MRVGDCAADSSRGTGSLSPVQARAVLARLNAIAERFFCDRLHNSWVPGYLETRGFDRDVQRRWHAGYAPAEWDALTRHLRARGCPGNLIEAAGLAGRSRRGTLADTFRDRAVLPVRSGNGVVLGFIGRAPDGAIPRAPKYINSPRTCLYDKSAALYGIWEGRAALSTGARPVIVEGPFDTIAVTTVGQGRYAALAPCGTALTPRHVGVVAQVADLATTGVVVAFDSDKAGRHAAVRAYNLLTSFTEGLTRIAFVSGQDPAQVLAERGPNFLARMLSAHTQPLADLVVDEDVQRWARWLENPEGQMNALRSAARLIGAMPPSHVARQVIRLANQLNLDHAMVTQAVIDTLPLSR
jgi:DNA primase